MWKLIGWIIWIVTPRVMKLPPWQSRKLLLEVHALQTKGFREWQKHEKLVRKYAMAVRARMNAAEKPNPSSEVIERLTRQEEKCYEAVVNSELLIEDLRVDAVIASNKFLKVRKEQVWDLIQKERERQMISTPAERDIENRWKNVREEAKAVRIAKLEGLRSIEKVK